MYMLFSYMHSPIYEYVDLTQ